MLILGYPLGDVTIGLFKLPSRFGLAVKLPGLARLAICLTEGVKSPVRLSVGFLGLQEKAVLHTETRRF